MVWPRPDNVRYPNTWSFFLRTDKKHIEHFLIKDLDDANEYRIHNMLYNQFLKEPHIHGPYVRTSYIKSLWYTDITKDKPAIDKIKAAWNNAVNSKMVLFCLVDHYENPKIAGIHMTMIKTRMSDLDKGEKDLYSVYCRIVRELTEAGRVFERIGTDRYLSSSGLYVDPEYRKQTVATHLVKARELLCRACGVKASVSVFSTPISQKIAEAAGYEVYAEISVDEVKERYGLQLDHDLKLMGQVFA